MRSRIGHSAVALGLAASLCAGVLSCGGAGQEPTVTIVVPWATGGLEYSAFSHVAQPFAQKYHFRLDIQSTTAVAQQLDADEATGELPDLADLPSPGAVEQYEKGVDDIHLESLPSVSLGSYDQPWRSLAESASGTVYAVPVKADVKSLIWYRTGVLPGSGWAALKSVSRSGTPWCLGLANGSASGWPGADWVADILLSSYPKGVYERWLQGAWTSGQVKASWQDWGDLIRDGAAVPGGGLTALKTSFNDAITTKGCELAHGALSATFLTSWPDNYSYESFPPKSSTSAPVLVSGDFMGLFADNPYARMLLKYLASNQAQMLWVKQSGYAFSADNKVTPIGYPAGMERGIAKLLMPGTGRTLCFSAEDIMPPDLSAAFEQAILDYVYDSGTLDDSLIGLQKTATGVENPAEQQVAANACSLP